MINQNQDQSIYWPTFRTFYGQILFFFILIIKVCNVWNMCSQPPNWNLKEPWSKLIFYQASSTAKHGLRTPSEEITFTARPKIKSQSQIYRYGRSKFCLPHRPKISDELCLHWVSVVRGSGYKCKKNLGCSGWFFHV